MDAAPRVSTRVPSGNSVMMADEVFGAVRQRSERPPVPEMIAEPLAGVAGGVVGFGFGVVVVVETVT